MIYASTIATDLTQEERDLVRVLVQKNLNAKHPPGVLGLLKSVLGKLSPESVTT